MDNLPPEKEKQTELFTAEKKPVEPDIREPWLDGRDELNLAEFPLAALSNRIASDQKTLEFKDTIFDKQAGQLVERKLTVAASDKYGLPNALDDEIILALIQLAKKQGFASKTVPFSRYEIIQILGWGKDTWNYHRVLESLERWTSITLKYENAWWDPNSKSWVNETFHIIDRLTEVKEDGRERAAFVWNDVLFNNLRSGHLKTLDLEMYRRLTNPTAKRLYRLLDKRFFHRRSVKFNLVELTYHKLGISKNYQGNIKQRLEPAIKELEDAGVIKPASKRDRYSKHGVGEWNIIFEKASPADAVEATQAVGPAEDQLSDVEIAMTEIGVSENKAARLATTYPEEYLRLKIDEVRFLISQHSEKVKNPAGFLVKSIEEKFTAPLGYVTPEEKARLEETKKKRAKDRAQANAEASQKVARQKEEELRQAEAQTARVEAYLSTLTKKQRALFTAELMQRERNRNEMTARWIDEDSKIGEVYRKQAIEDAVLLILENHKV